MTAPPGEASRAVSRAVPVNSTQQELRFNMALKEKNGGFSIVELLMVVAVIAILAVFTVMTISVKEVYNADDRAYVVLDFLKEARQRALTQREVMRVEINRDRGVIRLINENNRGDITDDEEIRSATFSAAERVIYDRPPNNIDAPPSEATPVPTLQFKLSVHPSSAPDNVATLRFQPNGTVEDAGSNDVGDNASVTGATIYFWTPIKNASGADTDDGDIIRAITVLGGSGNTNYLMCPVSGTNCSAWK